jgi:hypothetical protein
MYTMSYNGQSLFDPYEKAETVYDAKISGSVNTAAYLDFKITPLNPLYDVLKERDQEVWVKQDDVVRFKGKIESIEDDMQGNRTVSCSSRLAYLKDTRVRPYSTDEPDKLLKAPSQIDAYFQWLIDQHNSRLVDASKRFTVGVNQGASLSTNVITAKNESLPTTGAEIDDKILSAFGGYLVLRYEDDMNYLDLYADIRDMNSQIMDFGVNILDFTNKRDTTNQYTAIRPYGGTPESQDSNVKQYPVTIEDLPDGQVSYNLDFFKDKDVVYSQTARAKYGYVEYAFSDQNVLSQEQILKDACVALAKMIAPIQTLDIKAIDLSLYMKGYKFLDVGQAVRVRSKPHGIDEYLMVDSIDLDLNNPESTSYVLGTSYDTLTGQQSGYLKSLNASINASLDAAASISGDLNQLSDKAIVDTTYQYATSDSDTTEPTGGWTSSMPQYIAGKYLWQRPLVTYGNGVIQVKDPAMITGNSAASLKINSSQGNTFKNGNVNTELTVKVFYGSMVITTLADLKLLYGDTASLHWRYQPFDQDDFIDIASNDPRLTNDGFTLKVTSSEVTNKAVFQCIIDA